jgi:GTPase SAR1 family protein
MSDLKAREVKVVLLGHQGVGKSSIVLRFVTNNYRQDSESTIGASYMSKLVMVNNKPIKFQVSVTFIPIYEIIIRYSIMFQYIYLHFTHLIIE